MKSKDLPYIEYTLFALSATSIKNLTQLQCLQNHGLRISLQAPRRTHISDLHMQTNVMLISHRLYINVYKLAHKIVYSYDGSVKGPLHKNNQNKRCSSHLYEPFGTYAKSHNSFITVVD